MRRLVGTRAFAGALLRHQSITGAPLSPARHWAELDTTKRKQYKGITESISKTSLCAIREKPPVSKRTAQEVASSWKTAFPSSLYQLVEEYEGALQPVRQLQASWEELELESHHLKDDLKRGTSAFRQDHLDKCKTRYEAIKKEMAAKKEQIAKIAQNLTTALFNDIINILRIAAEREEHARQMAILVLEDMTLLNVPFDATTQLLLKSVTFGDGPFQDSNLLFSFVEYPERGEISLSQDPLEKIADRALKTISDRHQTPITDGVLLRQGDTHPMIQRSPE